MVNADEKTNLQGKLNLYAENHYPDVDPAVLPAVMAASSVSCRTIQERARNQSLLSKIDLNGNNKIEASIAVIKEHEPPEGYYLAFSGVKDSLAVHHLCVKAGIKFDSHYHPSPLDPPEQIRFIRQHYPDTIFEKPIINFWQEFMKKGFPTRRKRWCCEYIKEWGGTGRVAIMGIRGNESA